MYKNIICFTVLIIFNIKLFAQFNSIISINELEVKNYLIEKYQIQYPNNFELIYKKKSPVAIHYTFQVTHKNIPIWNWIVKINISNDGKILSIFDENFDVNKLIECPIINNPIHITMNNECDITIEKKSNYFLNNSKLIESIILHKYSYKIDSTYIYDSQNHLITAFDNVKYLKIDTTILGKIFLPDPLTTAHQYYGSVFSNNNDADALWLDNAQQLQTIKAIYNTDSSKFFLENAFAKISDFDLPTILPVSQTTNQFFFTRNQSGFEDVNALFHITNFHQYLDTLGYGNLMNLQIDVDAHGANGADNSVFVYSGIKPTLNLGTGGVNDAEDADVIRHEYCHGISWSANANTIQSAERQALDEGIADYFATSFSKYIDTFRWAEMFTWDGHNEFWDGRVANTNNNYSSPFVQGIYYGGEIWNCAMMKIWDDLGRQTTDKLMLQALYSFSNSTKLPDAAALVLQADSLLFNSAHTQIICNHFREKNIEPTWGACWAVGIINNLKNNNFKITNLNNFANNIENLILQFSTTQQQIKINIYDVQGKLICEKKFSNTDKIYLEPNILLNSGVYLMSINVDENKFQTKIIKF